MDIKPRSYFDFYIFRDVNPAIIEPEILAVKPLLNEGAVSATSM